MHDKNRDNYGRVWPFPRNELCPGCGQPDSCGDCNHVRLTDSEVLTLGGALPKPRYGLLGLDWIDGSGVRHTTFQWCHVTGSRIEAHASIDLLGDEVERILVTPKYAGKERALLRLAQWMRSKTEPTRFGRPVLLAS